MALYIDGNKVVNSLVIDGQVEGISLVNNCRIGVTASNKAPSPVDVNNYIDVSGTTVTLKRNNNSYHLWIYSPQLLQVGKAYAFVFDSITNYDDNYYIEYTSDISANPIVAMRIGYVDTDNLINGFVIEPTVSAYYGVAIWRNNMNDIVVNNPRFVEIGKNTGGGGSVTPTFSETVLVDNSSLATSFTFSEDYHNYDFLKFIIYNTSSGVETSIITTPSTVDAVFSIGSYINFNEFCNNQYCTYTQSNLTWNRSGARNCLISKVIGLNCTNLTVEETEIYKATSQTGTSVDITTQEDLMIFDWILFCSNDGSYDEVQPCINIFVPSNNTYELKDEYSLMYVFNPYNTYSIVYISRNYISSNTYAYVVGIKFTST